MMIPMQLYRIALALLAASAGTSALPQQKSPFTGTYPLQRPNTKPYPKSLDQPQKPSLPRDRFCFVKASGGGKDDAPEILRAFHSCNKGGTVVLDANYTISSILDLTFLQHVDVAIQGTISFGTNITYWVENMFKYPFQDSSSMWRIGGKDVNIFGNGIGLINGNGQAWWDAGSANPTLYRPVLLVIDELDGGSITGLNMINSPKWFNLIANSSDILISDINISAKSTSANPTANSDGWDTYRSDSIIIQNSVINNSDDCVSFKPNSTNVIVQGLRCSGSHGISVGSLGQYIEQYDIVENVYVYNITMSNASDGARIKVWPGVNTIFQPGLTGGGGAGYVRNVTYELFHNINNEWAIEINQCYGQSNQTLCNLYPSNMTISDVYFKDMWGTTSTKHDPKVGTLVCSSTKKCSNIQAHNVTISPPSGKAAQWICRNMVPSLLENFDCVDS